MGSRASARGLCSARTQARSGKRGPKRWPGRSPFRAPFSPAFLGLGIRSQKMRKKRRVRDETVRAARTSGAWFSFQGEEGTTGLLSSLSGFCKCEELGRSGVNAEARRVEHHFFRIQKQSANRASQDTAGLTNLMGSTEVMSLWPPRVSPRTGPHFINPRSVRGDERPDPCMEPHRLTAPILCSPEGTGSGSAVILAPALCEGPWRLWPKPGFSAGQACVHPSLPPSHSVHRCPAVDPIRIHK